MTRFAAYLEEAIASLWRNRVRSALTMLGMIIGSASIIAVFGISKAATTGIASTFSSFGELPVVISIDQSQDYPDQAQIQYRDLTAVAATLGDGAASVQPAWQRVYSVAYGTKHDYITIAQDGSYHTDALEMSEGRKISQEDVETSARVCVLTADVAREFFGDGPAVGNDVRINGGRYRVVGVYADIKGSFLNTLGGSSQIAIPYTTFYKDFSPGPVDVLIVYPRDPLGGNDAGALAQTALRHIHGERAKYTVQNAADLLSTFVNVLNIVGTGLSAIGAVALVVAGIGIMNIMLVSVTERTREIGIRKAIGANRNDIALQFLMESVILSMAGGLVGMTIGLVSTVGATSLLSKQLGEMIVPYLLIVSIALTFSILVGTVFGTYPALRAAGMDPIEALRS